MGKTKNTPPAFLQKRLDNKTFAFVKGNIKEFIAGERVKVRAKGLPESPQLLRSFFVFLAFKSKKFQNIKPDALSTTYPGVGQIYDLIRKRNKPTNEESAALKIKEDLSGLLKEKKTDSKKSLLPRTKMPSKFKQITTMVSKVIRPKRKFHTEKPLMMKPNFPSHLTAPLKTPLSCPPRRLLSPLSTRATTLNLVHTGTEKRSSYANFWTNLLLRS